MTEPPSSLSARLLVRAVRVSLRLADESVDSLTSSQLLALQFKLGETFNIIDAKIRDREKSTSGKPKVIIDLSDWEDDDETDETADEQMQISEDAEAPPPIPSPHLTATPLEQETAGVSDTADNGHEVGTLVYSISSTHATNTSSTHATNM